VEDGLKVFRKILTLTESSGKDCEVLSTTLLQLLEDGFESVVFLEPDPKEIDSWNHNDARLLLSRAESSMEDIGNVVGLMEADEEGGMLLRVTGTEHSGNDDRVESGEGGFCWSPSQEALDPLSNISLGQEGIHLLHYFPHDPLEEGSKALTHDLTREEGTSKNA
jgi:hypothetical protein